MSTAQIALDNLKARKLAYWKLYKGSTKVSQCDREENPRGDIDLAVQLFEEELETRQGEPGTYTVNVYRAVNGDKGGFRYNFTISPAETFRHSYNRQTSMGYEDIRANVEREIKMFMILERLESKVDAIGEFILSKTTDSKEDDNEALKFLTGLFGQAIKKKASASNAVSSRGFSSL